MRTGLILGAVIGGLVMSAATAGADDKKEAKKEEVASINRGSAVFDELVTIRVFYTGSGSLKNTLTKPQEVWASRRVLQGSPRQGEVIQFTLDGLKGSTSEKRLPFAFESEIGKGSTIVDAKGDEYTVTEVGGRSQLEVKLTKKAADKKEDKK